MAIDKQTAPLDSPETLTDWQRLIDITDTLALSFKNPWPVKNDKIIRGSCFYIGGAWYVANVDVAISGTASDYIQMTVDTVNSLIAPAYVSTLVDVTWNDQYNGWYDTTGHFYVFDENVAYAAGLIDFPRTVVYSRPRNVEAAKFFANPLGNNWANFLATNVDTTDPGTLSIGLPNTLYTQYNFTRRIERSVTGFSTSDWKNIFGFTFTGAVIGAFAGLHTIKAFRIVWENSDSETDNQVRIMNGKNQIAIWNDHTDKNVQIDIASLNITDDGFTVQYREDDPTATRGPMAITVSMSCCDDLNKPTLFEYIYKAVGGGITGIVYP